MPPKPVPRGKPSSKANPKSPRSSKSSRSSRISSSVASTPAQNKYQWGLWFVPPEKHQKLSRKDQIRALTYILAVAVPYCLILCIMYIIHYGVKNEEEGAGPTYSMVTGLQAPLVEE